MDPFVRWTIVVTQFNTIRLCPLFFPPSLFFSPNFHAFNFSIVCNKAIAIVLSSNPGEKNLSMVVSRNVPSILYIYIYILDRFNFNSIALFISIDQNFRVPRSRAIFFAGLAKRVSQQDFDPNDHVERLDSRERQFSRRLRFNPADVSTCRIIHRYYITSFRLRDADISCHGCTFQFVRQIRSFRLNRNLTRSLKFTSPPARRGGGLLSPDIAHLSLSLSLVVNIYVIATQYYSRINRARPGRAKGKDRRLINRCQSIK